APGADGIVLEVREGPERRDVVLPDRARVGPAKRRDPARDAHARPRHDEQRALLRRRRKEPRERPDGGLLGGGHAARVAAAGRSGRGPPASGQRAGGAGAVETTSPSPSSAE